MFDIKYSGYEFKTIAGVILRYSGSDVTGIGDEMSYTVVVMS